MSDHDELPPAVPNLKPARRAYGRVSRGFAGIGAAVCLFLAGLGFFLPLLPCTPFLLLASFLLVRCSPSMHRRLTESKYFGRLLTDWEVRGGIRPRDKARAILVMVAGVILTLVFGNLTTPLRFALLFLVTVGLWVILRLPVAKDPT